MALAKSHTCDEEFGRVLTRVGAKKISHSMTIECLKHMRHDVNFVHVHVTCRVP